jgi:hypothetical protein
MRLQTKLKTEAQRALERAPAVIADPVYHGLQHLTGGLAINVAGSTAFLDRAERLLREQSGTGFEGKRVVELGSGWSPIVPLLLLQRGAAEVHSFDLNAHYSRGRIKAAARAVQADAPSVGADLRRVASTGRLPAEVVYHPRTPIERAALAPGSVDVALSRFVLEHVPPDDLVAIHRASRSWLGPDGCWVHNVSPSDHRSYGDDTMSTLDFLAYDDATWSRLAGNRYAYHNRLRRPDYRAIFPRAGWHVVVDTASIPADPEGLVARVGVAERFRSYTAADLAAGNLWFLLTPED